MTILQTKDLRKTYGRGEARVHALDGVDLEIVGNCKSRRNMNG